MINLIDLEKKINSELNTKIKKTEIKHNQIYVEIEKDDLIDVTLFIKTNKDSRFKQLIDITVVDYPESIQRFKLVCNEAIQNGIRVRGYISCVLGCPYQGSVNPIIVADIAERLLHLGCYEVSLGDTIGVGTANRAAELIQVVTRHNPVRHFAVHFHDTYGQALANIYAALQQGIATIDSAVSGLGGCPYAPGAAGNVATEDVLYMLDGMNIEHNINSKAVTETAHFVLNKLGKSPISRVSAATRNL